MNIVNFVNIYQVIFLLIFLWRIYCLQKLCLLITKRFLLNKLCLSFNGEIMAHKVHNNFKFNGITSYLFAKINMTIIG